MRRLYAYGFEGGDLYGFTTSGTFTTFGTLQTTDVRTGAYALDVNPASAATGMWAAETNLVASSLTQVYNRFSLKFITLPTTPRVFCRHNGSGSSASNLELTINTNGTISLTANNKAVTIGTSSTALITGVWYVIEVMQEYSGKSVALRINGNIEITFTVNSGLTTTNAIAIYYGAGDTAASAMHFIVDDIIGDNEEWVGVNEKVKRLNLNGIVTDNTNWTNVGSAPSKYEAVSEVVADDDTSYLLSPGSSAQQIVFAIEDPTTDMIGIRGVYCRYRLRANAAITSTVIPSWEYLGYATDHATVNRSTITWVRDIQTGSSTTGCPIHPCWERDILKNTGLGLRTSGTGQLRFSQIFLEITYSDQAGSNLDIPRREFIIGFHFLDASEMDWTINTSTVGTFSYVTHPLGDRKSLRVNPANNANGYSGFSPYEDFSFTTSTHRTLFHKFDFWATQYPTIHPTTFLDTYVEIWHTSNGATVQGSLRMYNDGSLQLYSNNGGGTASTSGRTAAGTIQLGKLHNIQLKCRIGVSSSVLNGLLEVFLDGALILSLYNISPGTSTTLYVRMGTGTAAIGGCSFYFSDIITDWCSMPPRDALTTVLQPTGAGTIANSGGETVVGTANAWDAVDDPPGTAADDDTTYVTTAATAGTQVGFVLADLPSQAQVIIGVLMLARVKRNAGTSVSAGIELRATNAGTGVRMTGTAVAGYANIGGMAPVIRGRSRWTPTLLNGAEVDMYTGSATQYRTTRIAVVVEYLTRIPTVSRQQGHVALIG